MKKKAIPKPDRKGNKRHGRLVSIVTWVPVDTETVMCQQQLARPPKCFGNSAAKAVSISQVVCGGLAIVLGVVIIVLRTLSSYIGYPIWTGALFLSTGIVGIFAAVRKTNCMIITFMILSIVSAVFTVVVLWIAAGDVSFDSYACWDWAWGCPNKTDLPTALLPTTPPNESAARVAMDSLLIILALLEAGLSIASSVMACCAVCPCCKGDSTDCCGQSYQPPAVAYQVGADGRLVQIPSQYVIQGGQPIAMTPFPPSQPQHATVLPAGAMAQQQPLVVTQNPASMAAAQGRVGAGLAPAPPAQPQTIQALPTVGHGGNIQYILSTSTPIPVPMPQAASQQQPRAQSVPQVQFQQPIAPQAGISPYPVAVQPQAQRQPAVPPREAGSAQPMATSPPPGYQPTDPGAPAVNQAFQAQEDDDVALIDE
ncbi:hypothetical protein Bbelb_206230 [Branchiostoma belcheri]|nr:hypothetical protein Bbelb_206230 [Branchiostoma belcheri]